jgi:superfamily II DNA or RNA helicase
LGQVVLFRARASGAFFGKFTGHFGGLELGLRFALPIFVHRASLRFDRGTLCFEGANASAASLSALHWDPRSLGYRAQAYQAAALVQSLERDGAQIDGPPWPQTQHASTCWGELSLRPYQRDAIAAWNAFARRAVVVLPTGAGKTRVALAAMCLVRAPALVLCPTRALLDQWRREVAAVFSGAIGVVGDGEASLGDITIMTFESAYRRMDSLGDRFAMLIVDEVHHFGSGARSECLEMCSAPFRLGLTATAPAFGSPALSRIERLVGPIACEVGLGALLGVHLSEVTIVRLPVTLSDTERCAYDAAYAPFAQLRAEFTRNVPGADWLALIRALSQSAAGREAIRGFHRATAIAALPSEKRARARHLLRLHSAEPTLVFTARTDDAYRIAEENLIAVITAETSRRERERVILGFREGQLRALVSAQVLNEGFDVPEARVAIILGSAQGEREQMQRIGRVLRKAPNKHAVVYELYTRNTIDDRRAQTRRRQVAARCAALG